VVSTRQTDLELQRERLLAALDIVNPEDLPKISRELRAVNEELETLTPAKTVGQALVDELKAKRARRSAS
jgi:hypothetical protein